MDEMVFPAGRGLSVLLHAGLTHLIMLRPRHAFINQSLIIASLLSKLADLEPEIGDFVGNIASDKIFSKTGCPSWSKYAVQDKTL
jgi:hypothetical protein